MDLKHILTATMLLLASTFSGQGTAIERIVTNGESNPGLLLTTPRKFYSPDKQNLHPSGLSADHFSFQAVKGKKQKLDSIVYQHYDKTSQKWIFDQKDQFFYNAGGNNIMTKSFLWNDTVKVWIAQNRNDYTYEGYGNVKQIHSYQWNKSSNQWAGYSRNDYSYNLNRQLTQNVVYTWDKTAGQWTESQKSENVYDVHGNIILKTQYKAWDKTLKQWIPDEKEEITYDTLGNYIQSVMYKYDETLSKWNNTSKTEWVWNNKRILVSYITFNWDKTANQWVNSGKAEYTIDAMNKYTQVISYTWDKVAGLWVGVYKTDYTYNLQDKITLSLVYSWNKTSKAWVTYMKTETLYDTNGKLQKESRFTWNAGGNKWIGSFQREYAYDTSRNKIQEMLYTWNAGSSQWVMNDKEEYAYDGTVSSSDLLFGDEYFLGTINDTVFTKLTGTVSYSRDAGTGQMVFSFKKMLFYSPFIINGDTTKSSVCEGKTYSFVGKIYSKAGFYSDTLVSSKGADSVVFLLLSVHPAYQPKVEIRGDTLVSPDPYSSYQWYTDAGIITGATKSKYVIDKGGKYHLTVTDVNGCSNSSATVTAIHSGAEGMKKEALSYTLLPNPCTGLFSVRLNSSTGAEVTLQLLNLPGQVIESRQVDLSANGHLEDFDLSQQGRGVYLLVITSGKYQSVGKIVVQ